MQVMGEGKFSRVVECYDRNESKTVAVKIIRSVQRYSESAEIEAEILRAVRERESDPRRSLIVGFGGIFEHEHHKCLVFEFLGTSVFDFLSKNHFIPFSIQVIRSISYQLIRSVACE